MLPPQPSGLFAAIDASPHADVVLVAHTGLDHMQSVGHVWRGLALAHAVEVAWRTVPIEQVPLGEEARQRWLDAKSGRGYSADGVVDSPRGAAAT